VKFADYYNLNLLNIISFSLLARFFNGTAGRMGHNGPGAMAVDPLGACNKACRAIPAEILCHGDFPGPGLWLALSKEFLPPG
jgi:hypothetical protein